jgi:hypothetical protein
MILILAVGFVNILFDGLFWSCDFFTKQFIDYTAD